MERKSAVVVRWKRTGLWECYSSLAAFCARHPYYPRHLIYRRRVGDTFADHVLELRRVRWVPHPLKTRRGKLPRAKPGPRRRPL